MNPGVSREGPQYLEDLATAYWFSEILFTAVELEVFTLIEGGDMSFEQISLALHIDHGAAKRFLQALCTLGLLVIDGERCYNTEVSGEFLVKGKENYQGDSVLWRKQLISGWQDLVECLRAGGRVNYRPIREDTGQRAVRIKNYISAMDSVARTKVREMIPLFEGISLKGEILDVGTGSGAVAAGLLERFPDTTATLMDLPEVLDNTREFLDEQTSERVAFCPFNILEDWPFDGGQFKLIILSNIVHAYSEDEISHILKNASRCLRSDGLLLIHDFFLEHYPEKAALFDLNMFINTYNGKVFSHQWIRNELFNLSLHPTDLIPLRTDTAVIIAGKSAEALSELSLNPVDQLIAQLKMLGFDEVYPISTSDVHVADWADFKCRFGCEKYGSPHCPPNAITPQKTKELLKGYSRALLLKGQPPTKEFQNRVLQAERQAFKAGFYKSLVFWAGPCSLCNNCSGETGCRNTKYARPSMEAAGIDVFKTVRLAGFKIEPLKDKNQFVTYFGLLLLE